ncbi:MAG: cytidylyltransferase domain-containing protein [Anaerolineae bacterium]
MSCSVVAIIQARMASSRLPGKVLLDIAGEPMLKRVVVRTSRATCTDSVLVATTIDASDDSIAAFCDAEGIMFTRGSQFDVLDRYYQAAREFKADIVVRVTADCPAIDPDLIDKAVNALRDQAADPNCAPRFDFVANRLPPPFSRTFPIGLDVEVCTFAALERAWKEGHEPIHREHVMPYLYEGVELRKSSPELSTGVSPRGFRVALLNHVPDYGSYRWTVDTPEDLEFMRQVCARFKGRDDFSWEELLQLVRREPQVAAINAAVQHKTLNDIDERATKR